MNEQAYESPEVTDVELEEGVEAAAPGLRSSTPA